MSGIWEVPVAAMISLTPERAVAVIRSIFRSECIYARIGPENLTISERITIADGGIDAEVNIPYTHTIPPDCIFKSGLTGFQIKSGTGFKPWTPSAIRGEMLDSKGNLYAEVERLVRQGGAYTLFCTGHDLTPEQRNKSHAEILATLEEIGVTGYEKLIEVLGASQLVELACLPPLSAAA